MVVGGVENEFSDRLWLELSLGQAEQNNKTIGERNYLMQFLKSQKHKLYILCFSVIS